MRHPRPLVILIVTVAFAGTACSADSDTASNTATDDTQSGTAVIPSDVCTVLRPGDFADVGFTVENEGEDVSENFNLATTTSVACQWTNFDDNEGGSWELVIGSGDAEAAFDFDLSLAEIDTMTRAEIGDESFFVDKVSLLDSTDHDFEAGVRIGDIYFTLSTTDGRGSDAIAALAQLVADRLTA